MASDPGWWDPNHDCSGTTCPVCIDSICADVDPGIATAVRRLREAGVETYESCQGGSGHPENPSGIHAYSVPTVRFHGDDGAGWHALSVLISLDLPVEGVARVWDVYGGIPHGAHWQVTFRALCPPDAVSCACGKAWVGHPNPHAITCPLHGQDESGEGRG